MAVTNTRAVAKLKSLSCFILIDLNPRMNVTIQRSAHLNRQMLYNLRNQLYHSHIFEFTGIRGQQMWWFSFKIAEGPE